MHKLLTIKIDRNTAMAGLAESPATRAKGWKLFGILLLFWLTPYHTIPTFNNPEKNKKRKKKTFGNIVGKEKCW